VERDDPTVEEKADAIWAAIDPVERDQIVRALERRRAEAEQVARANGTREEQFVARLLAFVTERGKPDDVRHRYILIWYARTHGERAKGLDRGRPSQQRPREPSARVAALVRRHLRAPRELKIVDTAIKIGWERADTGNLIRSGAAAWRKLFINDYLTDEERKEYKDFIRSVLPPIHLPGWRHRHPITNNCATQCALVGLAVLLEILPPKNPPDTHTGMPPMPPPPLPTDSAGSASEPSRPSDLAPDAVEQAAPAGEALREHPFFRLMLLGASSISTAKKPGSHVLFDVYNWEDLSEINAIPVNYLPQWNNVEELDRRAAQASAEGRNEEALALYKQLQAARNGGWEGIVNRKDIDDYILFALNRRLGHDSSVSTHPRVSGPSMLGLPQYEVGRFGEHTRSYGEALGMYGSCLWRGMVTPQNVLMRQANNLAASNWSHLAKLNQIYDDARRRAERIAVAFVKSDGAVISDNVVLWLGQSYFFAVVLNANFIAGCTIENPENTFSYPASEWLISSEYEGLTIEHPPGYGDTGIVQRHTQLPSTPTAKQFVIHWRMELSGRAVCSGIVATFDFCFLPDGRIRSLPCP
jgi:hypothetical protein